MPHGEARTDPEDAPLTLAPEDLSYEKERIDAKIVLLAFRYTILCCGRGSDQLVVVPDQPLVRY